MVATSWEHKKCNKLTNTIVDGHGNTRPKPINNLYVHCDYLRIALERVSLQDFEQILEFLTRKYSLDLETPWSPGAGAIWYPHKVTAIRGLVGGWRIDEEGLCHLMVDLPGEYWENFTPEDQWRIFVGLKHRFKVRCCRFDLAIDDPSYCVIPVTQMRKAYDEDYGFGFRKYRQHQTSDYPGADRLITDEYGSRNSGKFVRVYDHEGECMRFEAEFKRRYAPIVFEIISSLERPDQFISTSESVNGEQVFVKVEQDWNVTIQQEFAAIALGAIDFRDRGSRKDSRRAGFRDSVRLSFYQEFADYLQAEVFRVKLPEMPRSLQKTFEWMKRQVSATLSMFKQGLNTTDFWFWINQLVEYGDERMDRLKVQWAQEISKYPHLIKLSG